MIAGILRALFASFMGTIGFAVLLNAPKRAWIPASVIGALSFVLYWVLFELGLPEPFAIFMGAAIGSLLAQLYARRMRMIATIFLTLSIVPMVPGLGLYRCMELLGQGQSGLGAQTGIAAMITIVMIALGIGMGNYLSRLFAPHKHHEAAQHQAL